MKASSVEVGRRADLLLKAAVALDAVVPPTWAPDAGPDEVFVRGLARKIRQQAEILAGRARAAREKTTLASLCGQLPGGLTDEQREAGDRPLSDDSPRTARKDYSRVVPFTLDDDQVVISLRDVLREAIRLNRAGVRMLRGDPSAVAGALELMRGGIICRDCGVRPPVFAGRCDDCLSRATAGEPVSGVGGDQVPAVGNEPRTQEATTAAAKPDPAAVVDTDTAIRRDAEIADLARMIPPPPPAGERAAAKRDSPAAAVGRMALEVGDLRRALVQETRLSRARGRVLDAILGDLASLLEVSERASRAAGDQVPVAGMEPRPPEGRDQAAVRAGVIPP